LRRDFQASDMMVLSPGVQATIAFGGKENPELYRRLDGLRPARDKPSALPVTALTDEELLSMRRR
jgi:hypothetical protein